MVHAIHELYHLDWDLALAAYERAEADMSRADDVRAVTEQNGIDARERFGRDEPSLHADTVAEKAQNHFIDRSGDALEAVLKTLTPDHDAYMRKVKIMATGGVHYAVPWLARDTAFLIGRLYAAAPEGAR